jgi:hypothetical protein
MFQKQAGLGSVKRLINNTFDYATENSSATYVYETPAIYISRKREDLTIDLISVKNSENKDNQNK